MAGKAVRKTAVKTLEAVPVEEKAEGALGTVVRNEDVLFTVKLDNKKLEARTAQQVASIIMATQGTVAKYVVEPE